MRGIFCFRRDLRLHDNLGLIDLVKICDGGILPVFCLDPRQLDAKQNQYRSRIQIRFLFESLADLDSQIRDACTKSKKPVVGLTVVSGTPEECLPELASSLFLNNQNQNQKITVGWNDDVTPFSRERDLRIRQALSNLEKNNNNNNKMKIDIQTNSEDLTVAPVLDLKTGTGNYYKVFTPFCRAARALGVPQPTNFTSNSASSSSTFLAPPSTKKIQFLDARNLLQLPQFKEIVTGHDDDENGVVVSELRGGRSEGLKRISSEFLNSHVKNYNVDRDFPWQDKTTKLSAYFKFGCVSYREAHEAVTDKLPANAAVAKEALTREFFWATFYYYITYHFPHVLQGQKSVFTNKPERNGDLSQGRYDYNKVWDYGQEADERLQRWKEGKTGFPFIDAAMRQLNTTGWMHNRCRMAVSSFLTKDLRVDWREGEKYFAQKLIDYEPSANSGGWQWSSSVGADAQPYFRIFNPFSQSQKHDCNAVYAKKYIRELANVHPDDIHNWGEKKVRDKYKNDPLASKYPAPICDHSEERNKTLAIWKKVTGAGKDEGDDDDDDKNKKKKKETTTKAKPKAKTVVRRRQRSVSTSSSSSSSSSSSDSDDDDDEVVLLRNKNKTSTKKQPTPKNSAKNTMKQTTLDKWV